MSDEHSNQGPRPDDPTQTIPFWPKPACELAAPRLAEIDEYTLGEALRGDRAAFQRVVTVHNDRVYRFICVALGPEQPELAGAATVDTFVAVKRHLVAYPRAVRFSTWLYSFGWNVVLGAMALASRVRLPWPIAAGSELRAPSSCGHVLFVYAFDLLALDERVAALLHLEDQSVPEMAWIMRATELAARASLARACLALRAAGIWLQVE